jgi:hypothetical protein
MQIKTNLALIKGLRLPVSARSALGLNDPRLHKLLRTLPMNKSLVLASLVAAVALAACGKKEEAAPAPAPMAAPAPAPMAAPADAAASSAEMAASSADMAASAADMAASK